MSTETSGLRLAYRPPLARERLLGFLAARAIPGIEHVDGRTYARAMRTASGTPIVVELEPHGSEPFVTLRVGGVGGEPPELSGVVQATRRLFDLDADPEAIDATLASDPVLAPLVREEPGTRLPGATDGFELAVRAIVGQQV
ncbi:MAG TPA: AlkA N-terminal domain-containing protein, partial [Actinomycetota bacterium]|nr:AlkA N-terminal domain-containing protein [Actinomycetota bacterium]